MKKIAFILMLTLIAFIPSIGQTLDNIKLDNKQSILNDRAFLMFPTSAKNEARGTDIMSADPNANQETRIVFDIEKMRLVFFARELYSLADNNFFRTVSKQYEQAGFKSKLLSNDGNVQTVLSTPATFDSTGDAILVNSLVVKTRDSSLFRIDAYINPAAFQLKDQYIGLTEKVFQTLLHGTRTNSRNARQEALTIFGTNKKFKFSLPANYCITVDQKYDFQVFKFHKYQNLVDTNWSQLIIYTGRYPSVVYRDYGLSESDAKKVTGQFLGKKVDWLLFNISKEGIYDKEQIISCDNIENGLLVHIALLSSQQKSIDELTKIVEAIKLAE